MAIVLPNYAVVIDNCVYAMNGTQAVSVGDSETSNDAKNVLILKRYTKPSQSQVWDHVRTNTDAIHGGADLVGFSVDAKYKGKTMLQIQLMQLNEQQRQRIIDDNDQYANVIKQLSKATPDNDPTQKYLNIRNGLISVKMMETLADEAENNADKYDKALDDPTLKQAGQGGWWGAEISLGENDWSLPDKGVMDLLLKHGVYGSDTLRVSMQYGQGVLEDSIDALYAGLSEPGNMKLLPDVSEDVLDNTAEKAIHDFTALLRQKVTGGQTIVIC
jgi:hypothetical protein